MEAQEGTTIHDSWREMQAKLKAADKSQVVLDLIQEERNGADRYAFISRMIGRFRVLRKIEDDALIASIQPQKVEE